MQGYPLANALAPLHKVALWHDLAAGLLLPGAPLPPDSLEHHAAFLTLHELLIGKIEVEVDTASLEHFPAVLVSGTFCTMVCMCRLFDPHLRLVRRMSCHAGGGAVQCAWRAYCGDWWSAGRPTLGQLASFVRLGRRAVLPAYYAAPVQQGQQLVSLAALQEGDEEGLQGPGVAGAAEGSGSDGGSSSSEEGGSDGEESEEEPDEAAAAAGEGGAGRGRGGSGGAAQQGWADPPQWQQPSEEALERGDADFAYFRCAQPPALHLPRRCDFPAVLPFYPDREGSLSSDAAAYLAQHAHPCGAGTSTCRATWSGSSAARHVASRGRRWGDGVLGRAGPARALAAVPL